MKNLIIGKTSQLSHYFPEENHEKISSREIDYDYIVKNKWNNIYILFAEQRTFLANDMSKKYMFDEINYDLTMEVVNKLKNVAEKVVYFSTAELWNNTHGPVKNGDDFNFHENNYTLSKYKTTQELINSDKYSNVSIVYPFNFNGIYRKMGYLFSKVFDSIVNSKKIVIGDTHYYRDMIHPISIVNFCLNNDFSEKNILMGGGRLVCVNDFIKKLYSYYNLNYNKLVEENLDNESIYRKNIFYSSTKICEENELFKNTITDISLRGEYLYDRK